MFSFRPMIDIPLVILTVSVFIWHFNQWSRKANIETNLNLSARLPTARFRVILLFLGILLLCWLVNLAVWSLFALVFAIGLVMALAMTGDVEGGAFGLFGAADIIREWAFGFPRLVLHPPNREITTAVEHLGKELLGKTGVTTATLRPTGDALIEGAKYAVVSFDGGWIDAGAKIEVRAYRNGMLCVSPISP